MRVVGDAVVVAHEARARVGGRVGVGAEVDLGAVAGRQQHDLAADAARGERRQRRLEAAAPEVDRLAELDRGRPVADAHSQEAHR